jgi:hypothetical protein
MTPIDTNQPTPEQLEKHFSAMHDSVNLIKVLIEKTTLSETEKDELKRNKEHLTIMLGKDFILADSRDKKVFIDAAK